MGASAGGAPRQLPPLQVALLGPAPPGPAPTEARLEVSGEQHTRTVAGVELTRESPDTWAWGEWIFRKMEGQSLSGRQEWQAARTPKTGPATLIVSSSLVRLVEQAKERP